MYIDGFWYSQSLWRSISQQQLLRATLYNRTSAKTWIRDFDAFKRHLDLLIIGRRLWTYLTVVYAFQRALVVLQRQSREKFGGSNRITVSLPTLIHRSSYSYCQPTRLSQCSTDKDYGGSYQAASQKMVMMTFNLQYSHPHFLLSDHCRPMLRDSSHQFFFIYKWVLEESASI